MEISPTVDLLVRARREADGGQLTEALVSCEQQLARVGPSADLYSLMGAVHQARQEREEAVRCYQRAVYLEPKHTEALAQLMLLCEEQGDDAQAGLLRRRLQQTAAEDDA
jgi:chemotaxis protein methyltransferase WspC